jgi:uncharacterized membrane protein
MASVLLAVVFAGYPVLIWWGLSHARPRVLALALLLLLLPLAAVRVRGRAAAGPRLFATLPLITVAALSLTLALDASGYMLLVPVAINALLLLGFGATLRPGARPMIESFARIQSPDLTGAQQDWCRTWTWIWCGFFLANGATAGALAFAAPLSWWATYTGLIAYVLMGALLALEWCLRRRRFSATLGAGGSHGDAG